MNTNDWYDAGAKIGELVQSAIDNNNFRSLNQSITDTINDAIEHIGLGDRPGGYKGPRTYRSPGPTAYDRAKHQAGGQGAADRLFNEAERSLTEATGRAAKRIKGVIPTAVGFAMAVLSGLATLAMGFLTALTGLGLFRLMSIVLLIMTIVFVIMGVRGSSDQAKQKQAQQILRVMGNRDTITFEELAAASGKSVKAVRAQVKDLVRKGSFQGPVYIDEQETCLMTSRSAYQQYQSTMNEYRRREQAQRQEAQNRRAAEKEMESYPEETQKILADGKEFIAHIHECNEQLPGSEISEKLERLEQVVTRIFEQVAADPSSAPDLHRMLNYYLPTTRKLVDAYVDLDRKQLSGKNVTKTKQEIEASLDTINVAFEALLDSFFQDTAWDISSDISTLKTMMARDGLTGRDFTPGEKIKTVSGDLNEQAAAPQERQTESGGAAASQIQTQTETQTQTQTAGHAGSGIHLTFGDGAGAAAQMPDKDRQ